MRKHHIVFDLDGTLFNSYTGNELYEEARSVIVSLNAIADLSILTAGDFSEQWNKIEKSGISRFFGQIIVVREKPHKQQVLKIFKPGAGIVVSSLKPKDVIVVGDRIEFEIAFGRKLGYRTVRILQGPHRDNKPKKRHEKADVEIKNLNELMPIVRR